MEKQMKILMLEDSSTDAEIVQRVLKKGNIPCDIHLTMTKDNFIMALDEFQPDIILADNSLPQFDAAEALRIVRERRLAIPFIMVTGTMSEEFAANIIKSGADDYILKDRLVRLPAAIEAALRQRQSEKEKNDAINKLISSEEKYRTLVQRIMDAFIALDNDSCFTYLNKHAGELLQRNPAELIGKNIWEEFPDSVGSATYKALQHAKTTQQLVSNIDYYAARDLWQENHVYPSADGLLVFIRDITEKKRLESKLQEQQRQAQLELTATSLKAQEKERNAIGIELHDNVNQILVGTNLMLTMARDHPEKAQDVIASCMGNIKKAIEENRKIAHELVTPDLVHEDLLQQLDRLARSMLQAAGIMTSIHSHELNEELLSEEQKLTTYRVMQEQCTNIIKYAEAKTVSIFLSTAGGSFTMQIKDDGKGSKTCKASSGIGLRNISSRLAIFNGSVTIESEQGKGFILEIKMPLQGG
jgi:PAS domain S-box-containing protein